MKKTRFLALLLVISMLFTFVACVTNEEGAETTAKKETTNSSTATTEPVTEPETTEYHKNNGLPTMSFNGSTYTIMACENYNTERGAQRDIVYFEDIPTNAINEGVHDRNLYIQDQYDVTVKALWKEIAVLTGDIRTANRSDLVICDAATLPLTSYSALIDENVCVDLNTVNYLDLTQSYWDQTCREAMSISNKLYFITGDIMLADKTNVWAIVFNRDIVTNNNLTDPYTLVNSGSWTYDQMYTMAKAATVIGSEAVSVTNYYGVLSEAANTYLLWLGNGSRLVNKDTATDKPIFGELSESAFDAMQKVATMQYDSQATIFTSAFTKDIPYAQVFLDGHTLFKVGSIGYVETLRNYEMDFGVLPMPSLTEGTKQYYSVLSPSSAYAFMIPTAINKSSNSYNGLKHLDYVGFITEALCCESTDTVIAGYYEKTMVYKGLRMEKDEAMLKLIFDNRLFDLAYVFDWADALKSDITSAKSEKALKRLKSNYDSYTKGITNAIAKFYTKMGLE